MKRIICIIVLALFTTNSNSQNAKEILEAIARGLSSNNQTSTTTAPKIIYKEVINASEIVNSSSNAVFSGGKTRAALKLVFPLGTKQWYYRVTVLDKDSNFYYAPDQSLFNLLQNKIQPLVSNQSNKEIEFYVIDDYSVNNFLETNNNNFRYKSDYSKKSQGFYGACDLIQNNLWIGGFKYLSLQIDIFFVVQI